MMAVDGTDPMADSQVMPGVLGLMGPAGFGPCAQPSSFASPSCLRRSWGSLACVPWFASDFCMLLAFNWCLNMQNTSFRSYPINIPNPP